jgi:hypothetical protein
LFDILRALFGKAGMVVEGFRQESCRAARAVDGSVVLVDSRAAIR